MNIALWITQGLLALLFLMGGFGKAFRYAKVKAGTPWIQDSSKGFVQFIGVVEILGALGLVLPLLTGILPSLTTLAALGISLTMLFAAIFHAKRKENPAIIINLILLALAVFVAYGRWFL
jgi:uncharacterized membrane protein YphA (DoxX/SURF4 family)